jgi:hypothetical protein
MNTDHITSIGRIAAKSLVNARPKHAKAKGKAKHPGGIYSLVASASQRENDPRINVIDDFIKAARSQSRGVRSSALREFIVEAIHSAIVKRAEEVEKRAGDLSAPRHVIEALLASMKPGDTLLPFDDYPRTEDEIA